MNFFGISQIFFYKLHSQRTAKSHAMETLSIETLSHSVLPAKHAALSRFLKSSNFKHSKIGKLKSFLNALNLKCELMGTWELPGESKEECKDDRRVLDALRKVHEQAALCLQAELHGFIFILWAQDAVHLLSSMWN